MAVAAHQGLAADGADRIAGETPAVEEQEHLIALLQGLGHGLAQLRRDEALAAPQVPVLPQVHDTHLGQRPVGHPGGEPHGAIAPLADMVDGLHGGGGRTQHHRAGLEPPAHQGQIPGIVAQPAVLLVGAVVLLVHHDEPDPGEGGENGRAGADGDGDFPAPQAGPLVEALAL